MEGAIAELTKGFESGKATIVTLADSVTKTQEMVKTLTGDLYDKDGKLLLQAKPNPAHMEDSMAGMVDKVDSFSLAGIPLGAMVIGTPIAVFGTELIDGLAVKFKMTNQYIRGGVKLATAAGVVWAGHKWHFSQTANVIGLLLTFDAVVHDILPQPYTFVGGLANKVTGTVTTGGLAPKPVPAINKVPVQNVNAQANKVAQAYYAKAGL